MPAPITRKSHRSIATAASLWRTERSVYRSGAGIGAMRRAVPASGGGFGSAAACPAVDGPNGVSGGEPGGRFGVSRKAEFW